MRVAAWAVARRWPSFTISNFGWYGKLGTVCPTRCPILAGVRKTSVYLNDEQARRLARLAREEGRSQAEVLREAVATYQPKPSSDRNFALAAGFSRIDNDPRPISQIQEEDLLEGFGR